MNSLFESTIYPTTPHTLIITHRYCPRISLFSPRVNASMLFLNLPWLCCLAILPSPPNPPSLRYSPLPLHRHSLHYPIPHSTILSSPFPRYSRSFLSLMTTCRRRSSGCRSHRMWKPPEVQTPGYRGYS